jgi:flavin-dependent dehydrogenase
VESADVIVVGGGPAGSACARRLHAAGLDVLVLDRATFPRDKPCAGWITPGVLEALAIVPEEYARGHTLEPITALRVGRLGGREVVVDYRGVVSWGIRRVELDQYLLRRSGARVREATIVAGLRRDGDGWVVNDAMRAPALVGAGGFFCPVARWLNRDVARAGVVVAQVVELPVGPAAPPSLEIPELFFCRDLRGYGWCFRKGDCLNVGLGRRDPRGLAAHVASFADFIRRRHRLDALPARWPGHAYRLYEAPGGRVFDDGVLLVGDAAGLAHPESGEGMGPAVQSGLLAAETLLAARGRYRRDALAPYAEAIANLRGPRRNRQELPAGLAALAGRLLLGNAWLARRIVLDRWFLHQGAHHRAVRGRRWPDRWSRPPAERPI